MCIIWSNHSVPRYTAPCYNYPSVCCSTTFLKNIFIYLFILKGKVTIVKPSCVIAIQAIQLSKRFKENQETFNRITVLYQSSLPRLKASATFQRLQSALRGACWMINKQKFHQTRNSLKTMCQALKISLTQRLF